MSLVLLVGAGLPIKTFAKLSGVSPGFDARNVLTMKMSLSLDTSKATARLSERAVSKLESLPGIRGVANITALPLQVGPDISFEIVGQAASAGSVPEEQVRSGFTALFRSVRIPIVAGRAFTERDTEGASAVVIINQALARKYFRKLSPLGERLLLGLALGPRFADVPRNYRRSGGHA
jgi:hypothetical protein